MIKEEAIEILSDMRAEYNIFSDDEEEATRYHALSWAIQALNEQQPDTSTDTPTDTPTVTYGLGRWIEKEDDGYHGGGYTECSVCGQRYSWGGYFEANGFRYCPRCGHRMEVEE